MPTRSQIDAYAAQSGIRRLTVHAFAAVKGRLPAGRAEIDAFQAEASDLANRLTAYDSIYTLDFARSKGRFPATQDELYAHMRQVGALSRGTFTPGWAPNLDGGGDPLAMIRAFWDESTTNKAILIGGAFVGFKLLSGRRLL